MRAKDIKVNAELLYSMNAKWAEGRDQVYRAVVVDATVQNWESGTDGWAKAAWPSRRINPPGVLVDVYYPRSDGDGQPDGFAVTRRVAQTVHLRGSWEECSAINERAKQQRIAEYTRLHRESKARDAQGAAVEQACAAVGIEVGVNTRGGVWVTVSGEAMAAMVAKLGEIGWRYDPAA